MVCTKLYSKHDSVPSKVDRSNGTTPISMLKQEMKMLAKQKGQTSLQINKMKSHFIGLCETPGSAFPWFEWGIRHYFYDLKETDDNFLEGGNEEREELTRLGDDLDMRSQPWHFLCLEMKRLSQLFCDVVMVTLSVSDEIFTLFKKLSSKKNIMFGALLLPP